MNKNEVREEYRKLLSGEISRFPRGFWEEHREEKATILFKCLFEEVLKWDKHKILQDFNSNVISEYKLSTPYRIVYEKNLSKLINSVYPNTIRGKRLPRNDETRRKMSKIIKNLSEEKKANIVRGMRENRYTVEYAKKLSDTKLGEINPQHKLKEKQVLEIKKLWKTGNYSTSVLGEKFGVKRQTIADIVYGRTWKHLE